MELKATRASAIGNLENFVENNLGEYSKLEILILDPIKDQILHAYHHT